MIDYFSLNSVLSCSLKISSAIEWKSLVHNERERVVKYSSYMKPPKEKKRITSTKIANTRDNNEIENS